MSAFLWLSAPIYGKMFLIENKPKGWSFMAKIISQFTFADYGQIEILGDLERFLLALLGMNDEALMLRLVERRGKGAMTTRFA